MPWREDARAGQPGHPLYVPAQQRAGRLDNSDHYRVLYLAENAMAAVAESFGSFELWTPAMLAGRFLAVYEAPEDLPLLDLDDAAALLERRLKPSQIVTRSREVTQRWALDIFSESRHAGVRWWSYYNPDWGSIGLWDYSRLSVAAVQELSVDSAVLQRAREVLMRSWVS